MESTSDIGSYHYVEDGYQATEVVETEMLLDDTHLADDDKPTLSNLETVITGDQVNLLHTSALDYV